MVPDAYFFPYDNSPMSVDMVALLDKEKVLRMKIRLAQYEDALPMARVIVDTFLSANRGLLFEWALQTRHRDIR